MHGVMVAGTSSTLDVSRYLGTPTLRPSITPATQHGQSDKLKLEAHVVEARNVRPLQDQELGNFRRTVRVIRKDEYYFAFIILKYSISTTK